MRKPTAKREFVERFIDALAEGRIEFNPIGWHGASNARVGYAKPAEVMTDLSDLITEYTNLDEPGKEMAASTIYGLILSYRIGGLITGEVTPDKDVQRLTKENQDLREEIKKLVSMLDAVKPAPHAYG